MYVVPISQSRPASDNLRGGATYFRQLAPVGQLLWRECGLPARAGRWEMDRRFKASKQPFARELLADLAEAAGTTLTPEDIVGHALPKMRATVSEGVLCVWNRRALLLRFVYRT